MRKQTKEERCEKQFIIDCINDLMKGCNDVELLNIIYVLLLKNRDESLYR